jgi:membrane-associated phospholipid phosphatase
VDESLLLTLNGLRAPWLDAICEPVSSYGYYTFPIVMIAAIAFQRWQGARRMLDGWLAWFLATFVTETIVKPIIARPRPTANERLAEMLDVLGSVPPATSLAFPSGTASAVFGAATFILLAWGWKPGVPALLFATFVSLTRIYAGIHWPSDVLGGAVVGALCALAIWLVARKTQAR